MEQGPYRTLMVIVFATVLAYTGAFLAREYTKLDHFVHTGDIWSFLILDDERTAMYTEVDRNDFRAPPYPAAGDSLVAIGGLPATRTNYFRFFNTETPPGREVPVRFKHDGQTLENTVVTRSIPRGLQVRIISLFLLRVLITVALILVGFWAFLRRPGSGAVRALALFCYTMALNMITDRNILAEAYASFELPRQDALFVGFSLFALFAPAFWLKLQLLFPETNHFYEKHRLRANALIFLPAVLFAVLIPLSRSGRIGLPIPGAVPVYNLLFIGLGYALLIRNHVRADNFLVRRQTRLVIWGAGPGLLLSVGRATANLIDPNLEAGWDTATNLSVLNASYLLILLIPIAFAWAFGRYRLLEVEARVRRGTRFLLVNALLLAAFLGIVYLFGEFLLNVLSVDARAPTLVVGLMLALGYVPTQRKLRPFLEKRFYPERVRMRALLRDFLQSAEKTTDAGNFWEELGEKLTRGLGAEKVRPVIRRERNLYRVLEGDRSEPFPDMPDLFEMLRSSDHPVLMDEMIASERIEIRDEHREWFAENRAAVLVPLATQSGLTGFLYLGPKRNGEDYAPEELDLLRSLAAQIALAAENIELLEQKIEKEKLEEQLSLARRIQEGLLPRNLPETPGLHIAARIRFCLNVAGDYYDVISLSGGRTLLAIGDVAGKGVGAALLMSNLQASLRSMKDVGIGLPEIMARINSLIYENTPPELFITLFVAIFDPARRSLVYVNAGHNCPVLVRSSGGVELLSEGGLLIGVMPEATYREERIDLAEGDRLVMFTDGASEATNSRDEEFGEERIARLVTENLALPPVQILEMLEREVLLHRGGEGALADDFTLVAAAPRAA
ncbi:MAG: SpoIIE family protein phosphatase [Candidatus Eisenbacteria bacterium]|nr:SpoIIE family protein phosphatase [Candidatus Eisenbacteria bacterium]